MFKLYDPVRKFGQFNNNFQQALGASSAIFPVLDADDEVRERTGRSAAPFHRSPLRARVLQLSPGEEAMRVLHDIDFEVRPGEVFAIVGSSGSGKTTLVHLLPRFFDVRRGRILIDGRDVRDLTVGSLRSQSLSLPRIPSCSTTRFAITSRMGSRKSPTPWKKLPGPHWRTTSSWRCRTAMIL